MASLALDADLSGEGIDITGLAARFAEAAYGDGEIPSIVLLQCQPSNGSST